MFYYIVKCDEVKRNAVQCSTVKLQRGVSHTLGYEELRSTVSKLPLVHEHALNVKICLRVLFSLAL